MSIALFTTIILIVVSFFLVRVGNIKYKVLSPPILINAFILLYVVLGFQAYWLGDYFFLGLDFSGKFEKIFYVSTVFSLVFTLVFLFLYYTKISNPSGKVILKYELNEYLFLFYFSILFFYSFLNLIDIKIPILHNFVLLFFNSLLVVVGYAFITKVKYSKLLIVLLTLLIVYMGFRYRLIFLFLPIIFIKFIFNKMSLSTIIKYFSGVVGGIFTIAIVGVARKYSSGLQVEKLEGLSFYDVLIKGIFNDTSTVMVSGAFIDWLDKTDNYAYFAQVKYVINYFIPNAIYPEKEYSPIFDHLSYVTYQLYNESGSAVLGFAEYYHTAGYFGVCIFAVLFALIYVRLFKRASTLGGEYNNYVYFVFVTWLINSFTRGYFPQNMQDLVSVIIGLYMIKVLSKKIKAF